MTGYYFNLRRPNYSTNYPRPVILSKPHFRPILVLQVPISTHRLNLILRVNTFRINLSTTFDREIKKS